ncbi:MAG: ABC transporter permease [Longimicrobiales bacterium]
MDWLRNDLRFALRNLTRRPTFTVAVVLTLTLGIGANLGLFAIVNGVLLRPPEHVRAPERLVSIYTSDFSGPLYGGSSYPDVRDIRALGDPFAAITSSDVRPFALERDGTGERIFGEVVDANYFELLGVRPLLGRFFAPDEGDPARPTPVVVLGHDLWLSLFAGAEDVVGRTIRMNGRDLTIIGVVPAGLQGSIRGLRTQAWVSLGGGFVDALGSDERGNRGLLVIGRLADGVSVDGAQVALDALAARLHAAYPDYWTNVREEPRRLTVVSERDARIPPVVRAPVLGFVSMLFAVTGLVLLIACANIASLMLARATGRQREVAIRLAIGASRTRVVRHLLTEGLVLAALGTAGALFVTRWGASALVRLETLLSLPISIEVPIDAAVVTWAVLLACITTAAFGLAPALRATRPDLVGALKQEAGVGMTRRPFGLRGALVILQVAGSLVLLIGGSLFLRSLIAAARLDLGFSPDNVVAARFEPMNQGMDAERSRAFFRALVERTRAMPGVESVALATSAPLRIQNRRWITVEGYEPQPGEDMEFHYGVVDGAFFETVRLPLVQGRAFDTGDRAGAPGVAIVNETFARRFWPGEDPIDRRLAAGGPEGEMLTVVGVARDGRYISLSGEVRPAVFFPVEQAPEVGNLTVLARVTGSASSMGRAIRDEARTLEPRLPVAELTTLSDAFGTAILPQRIAATALGLFGVLALSLAAFGLYGLVAYAVSLRTHEIGIRIALGAHAGDIRRLVVRNGVRLVTIGTALGLAAAFGVARFVRAFLFGVDATDPIAFIIAPAVLVVVTIFAAAIPARRAARVDPLTALRAE